jgi:hypothetical protein
MTLPPIKSPRPSASPRWRQGEGLRGPSQPCPRRGGGDWHGPGLLRNRAGSIASHSSSPMSDGWPMLLDEPVAPKNDPFRAVRFGWRRQSRHRSAAPAKEVLPTMKFCELFWRPAPLPQSSGMAATAAESTNRCAADSMKAPLWMGPSAQTHDTYTNPIPPRSL